MASVEMERIAEIVQGGMKAHGYSALETAILIGFRTGDMIEGIIGGDRRIPLDKVVPLADALGCDRRLMMTLAMTSWFGADFVNTVKEVFTDSEGAPPERQWLNCLRELHGDEVPELTPSLRRRLRLLVSMPQ